MLKKRPNPKYQPIGNRHAALLGPVYVIVMPLIPLKEAFSCHIIGYSFEAPWYDHMMSKQSSFINILREYSEVATVHGISYALSKSLPSADRIFWFLCTITW